ncbi:MAG: hypothetical protein ACJAWN_002306 [Neolewinella sp.]|jgi:hypothetical protein
MLVMYGIVLIRQINYGVNLVFVGFMLPMALRPTLAIGQPSGLRWYANPFSFSSAT